ncbi:MAG: 50S ribosomal protein L32e [Archaeoglobus sp.]|nr:MAG: 50S ribosomal protein L32e [Archaeoglobus sp.]
MESLSTLLKLRRRMKSKRPEFRRYESHKKLRLRDKGWRKPRGRHNKLRQMYGGKWSGRALVRVGYGSPSAVRGYHPCGKKEVLVYNPSQLESINPENQVVRIASCVGMKKRLAIEDRAKQLGVKVLNPVQGGE